MNTNQPVNPMKINLTEDRKRALLSQLTAFYTENFDETLSPFRAEQLLEFFVKILGPPVYNQAVNDARSFMLAKLDDLDAEFYVPEIAQ